jgi:hypothetical protein
MGRPIVSVTAWLSVTLVRHVAQKGLMARLKNNRRWRFSATNGENVTLQRHMLQA